MSEYTGAALSVVKCRAVTVGLNCLFQMIIKYSLNSLVKTPICSKVTLYHRIHTSKMAGLSRQFEDEGHSKIYAQYRPLPPKSLVWQILKNLYEAGIRTSGSALDVGCGSGS